MGVRVFVVSNGPWPDGDLRTTWAFQELAERGIVDRYRIVSGGQDGGHDRSKERETFFRTLEPELDALDPQFVLWHRDEGRDLSPARLTANLKGRTLIVQDFDPYMRFLKPISPNHRVLADFAKQIHLVGLGSIAQQFRPHRQKIRYFSHGYCDLDIPPPSPNRVRKLVFVGNATRRLGRILGPLGPDMNSGRIRATGVLTRELGNRFLAHGKGYPPSWNIRPSPFEDQFRIHSENWFSFSMDAAPGAAGYYSNRTAFALACGSIHIRIRRPLDEAIFRDCSGVVLVDTAEEAADAFRILESWSDSRLNDLAASSREFAKRHLRMPDLYEQSFRIIQEPS